MGTGKANAVPDAYQASGAKEHAAGEQGTTILTDVGAVGGESS
jgi:hypothetical protein